MRYVLCLIPVALIASLITFWPRHEPRPVAPPPVAVTETKPTPPVMKTVPPRPINFSETILVLPDVEVAPLPEPTTADENPGKGKDRPPVVAIPRPEIGERPWMPYADEDVDLSAVRRLQWAKLATQGNRPPESFEESEEPPVLETQLKR